MESRSTFEQWSDGARFWERHRAVIQRMFAPVADALAEEAEVRPGAAVLDVATGPGEPALSLAEIVGTKGSVVGVDVVPAMIDAARREAERRGVSQASFRVASGDALPFEDGAFDAVVSRFGVMFFPSPVAGLRELGRVLKPGKKLALAVWHHARDNPFHSIVIDALERFVDAPPLDPDAPDAFRYAEPGKLLSVVRRAGFPDAEERLLEFSIQAPLSLEDYWTVRTEMSDRLRTTLAQLPRAEVDAIRRQVLDAARDYVQGSGLSFPAQVLVVSARK
jgi:SAM-dependent methyltransferase